MPFISFKDGFSGDTRRYHVIKYTALLPYQKSDLEITWEEHNLLSSQVCLKLIESFTSASVSGWEHIGFYCYKSQICGKFFNAYSGYFQFT